MYRLTLIIRFFVFSVFFLAGSGAVVLSILSEPELHTYYKNRAALVRIQQQNEKIISLTCQYDTLINRIESEPNLLNRLIPLTFGQKPHATDTAFPQVRTPALQIETEKLLKQIKDDSPADPIPAWFKRLASPKIRRGLFLAGAGLVLITFIFFGITEDKRNTQKI